MFLEQELQQSQMVVVKIIGWHRDIMIIPLRPAIAGAVGSGATRGRVAAAACITIAVQVSARSPAAILFAR